MFAIRTLARLVPALGIALGTVACGGAYDDPNVPQNGAGEPQVQVQAQVQAPESEETIIGGTEEEADEYADTDPSAVTEFREPLAPYGTWVDDSNYGTVWVPHAHVVGTDFVPYSTGGHWVYDSDYTWVSDYSWGWAPFHYGRWIHADGRGWVWIPGRRYAPAWVTWRVGPSGYGYVGWGPAQPYWYWHNGYAYNYYRPWPSQRYVYCPRTEVFHANVGTRAVYSGPQHAQAQASTREYVPAQPMVAAAGKPTGPSASANAASRRGGPDPRRDLGVDNVPSGAGANTERARMFASPRAMAASNVASARATVVTNGAPSTGFTSRSSTGLASPRASSSFGASSPSSPSVYAPSRSAPSYASPSSSWSTPSRSYTSPSVMSRPAPAAASAPRASSPAIVSRPSVSSPSVMSRPSSPAVSRPSAPAPSRGSVVTAPSRSSGSSRATKR